MSKSNVKYGGKKFDAKVEDPKLNDCCKFCNNRLLLQAVKKNDVAAVKKLLHDYENITNPF